MARVSEKILMLDTETTNGLDCPFVYDIGCIVTDRSGKHYESFCALVSEVFNNDFLMDKAFYSNKIPEYLKHLETGERTLLDWFTIKMKIRDLCDKWNIKYFCAHNAMFDLTALNNTERYITKSKYRFFLPYGLTVWDTMKMAESVIAPTASYRRFCEDNGLMREFKSGKSKPRITAEALYRYIANDEHFKEEHKALEDVQIEIVIMAYCFGKHKPMRTELFNKDKVKNPKYTLTAFVLGMNE